MSNMADHTEKRIRREIANSNERRRMQSINTGFNSLRTMLPKHDGEKLSKAAILQHTAEYIDSLEHEKTRLLAQQHQLKRLVTSIINGQADIKDLHEHQLLKKIKIDHHNNDNNTDSSDEGICNASPIEAMDSTDDLKAELIEVRKTVDRERKLRMQLEETIKTLETQLHPERVKEITHQVQVKLHNQQYETGSMDNSENENDVAVASLVDYDENVIAETIEIETRSCPGSPQQQQQHHQMPTTIVIQGANNTFSSNPIQLRTAQGQIIKVQPAGKRNTSGGVQVKGGSNPAAIALPIEMPYISNTGSGDSNNKNNTVTVQILNGNDQAQASHTQSRHNLETIVEAIRHLEGDHMFKDDSESNVYDEEEVIANEEVVAAQPAPQVTTTTTTAKAVASVSSERLGAIRQKVIKNNLSNTGRPGVIVAKIK